MTRLASIPENRKQKLDTLFDAFSIIGEDTYVYLCDMRYDISRWSKSLVEAYDLPGEYMIAAGDIWEEHIHPEYFGGAIRNHNQQSQIDTLTGLRNQYGFFEDNLQIPNFQNDTRIFVAQKGNFYVLKYQRDAGVRDRVENRH